MAERKLQRGSTFPDYRMLMTDGAGSAIALTDADSIELYAKQSGGTATFGGTLIPDAGQDIAPTLPLPLLAQGQGQEANASSLYHMTGRGWTSYAFTTGDTDDPGTYKVWAGITWAPGDVEWLPNTGNETLTIEDRS